MATSFCFRGKGGATCRFGVELGGVVLRCELSLWKSATAGLCCGPFEGWGWSAGQLLKEWVNMPLFKSRKVGGWSSTPMDDLGCLTSLLCCCVGNESIDNRFVLGDELAREAYRANEPM